MKKSFVSAIMISVALTTVLNAKEHKNKEFNKDKKIAKLAIQKLGKMLKSNLMKTMKKDGPVGAVEFCSSKSGEITKEINSKLKSGVSIKRVTLNPRNEKNLANESEKAVLTALEALKQNGVVLPKMIVQKIDDKHTKVYKPLVIMPKCLICHGTDDKINKDAAKAIKEKYPNDKATGYKKGDLRGAFVVDIVKK